MEQNIPFERKSIICVCANGKRQAWGELNHQPHAQCKGVRNGQTIFFYWWEQIYGKKNNKIKWINQNKNENNKIQFLC